MKERPILMSGPNIPPLLDGSKTQTRRALRASLVESINFMGGNGDDELATIDSADIKFMEWRDDDGKVHGPEWCVASAEYPEEGVVPLGQCPHGVPGDRLWVKETWMHREGGVMRDAAGGVEDSFDDEIIYRAAQPNAIGRWKPSIFMPRWASRILLEVTAIRVERLQDISEADAWAEGCEGYDDDVTGGKSGYREYAELWESINGAGSWLENPWVWVVEFKRIEP